jgi:RND superfamily putative drug exporter
VQFTVVTDAARPPDQAFEIVAALRNSAHGADLGAVVGAPTRRPWTSGDAAVRDRLVPIPAILAVLAVLFVLLRAVVAPLILVAVTVLSGAGRAGPGRLGQRASGRLPGAATARHCSRSCSWSHSASTTPSSW